MGDDAICMIIDIHGYLKLFLFAKYSKILVSIMNQHKLTINKGFDAWVDAEKYYIGTPPILDSKIYPDFCRHENLANGKSLDPSRLLFGRDTLVTLKTSLL